jgi:hypothetical protein
MSSALLAHLQQRDIPMSQTVSAARAGARVRHPPEWMGTTAAAQRAKVTPACIVRWASEGLLRGHKVVGRWRIDPRDLDRLLAGGEATK